MGNYRVKCISNMRTWAWVPFTNATIILPFTEVALVIAYYVYHKS